MVHAYNLITLYPCVNRFDAIIRKIFNRSGSLSALGFFRSRFSFESARSFALILDMPFTLENGRLFRQKRLGRKRALVWSRLGFQNLVLARLAKAKKREARLRLAESKAGSAAPESPYTLPRRGRGF